MRRAANLLVVSLTLASLFVTSLFPPQAVLASPLQVVTISPTKTDAIVGDDGDNKADPGETIEYTVVIPNSGDEDATGVTFQDVIDANTTLVGGSLSISPIGVNDTFPVTVVGNVSINSANLASPFSVTSNDFLGLNPSAIISAYDATTTNGGQVVMTTSGVDIGKFTYDPPAGFEGTDTFTYTLADNPNATSAAANRTATVSITVSGMIWFINNNAASCTVAGCGRLSNPFSTLAAFNTLNNGTGNNPAANDNIFIYESATGYSGAVTLLTGQRLIGQDATTSLSTITGLTAPTGSASLPTMNSVNGTVTNITNTVTLNTNTTVRGLSINSTVSTGMTDPAGAITGVSVGEVKVSTTTGTGVNFSNTAGSLNFIELTTTGGTGGNLTNNTGSTFTFSDVTVSSGANAAFTATGGGTVNICDENPCNPAATGGLVNTLTSTTSTALNITNTTIGSNNLEFRSISSTGGSATGIILVNSGSTGALVVKGDGNTTRGGNGSGGTITNKTGGTDGDGTGASGVYINNGSATLRNMTLTRFDNFGLYGLSVNNVTLQYSTVGAIAGSACADADGDIGTSSGAQDAGIVFGKSEPSGLNGFNSGGTMLLDNLLVYCSIEHQIEIYQQANSFSATISNSDVKDNSTGFGSDGILIETHTDGNVGTPAANGTILIQNNAFDDNKSQPVQAAANGDSVLDVTITGNAVTRSSQGNEGFILSNGTDGRLTTHITNNIISGIGGVSIFVGQTPGNANDLGGGTVGLTAFIKDNTITAPASATNHAIIAYLTSTVGQVSRANILIESNTIIQNGINRPILVDTPDVNTTPSFTATVLNNNITVTDLVNGVTADVTARRGAGCFDVRGNTVSGPFGIRVRQAAPATVQLEQGVSGSAVPTTVLDDNHPAGTVTTVLGTPTVVGNSTCLNPPVAMVPGNNIFAQDQNEIDSAFFEQTANTDANSAATFIAVSDSVMLAKQTSTDNLRNVAFYRFGGDKPLFLVKEPAPALSGETVGPILIGTLPPGKSVKIKFQVTVDPLGSGEIRTRILNQGAVSGGNFTAVSTTDPSPNADPACTALPSMGSQTCTPVDRPDTTVTSITRQSANPTNASTVTWQIVFASPVSGLTPSNFSLVSGGSVTGASITGVTETSGPPSTTWNVTANTGTGDGTLELRMANDTSLSHDVTNQPYTQPASGAVYTIDKNPPTVTINQAGAQADPTNVVSINFTVVFSEAVTDFDDAADVTLSGTAGATTVNITGGPTTYNVAVSGMTGDGTVIVSVPANVAQDAAGNNNNISTSTDNTVTYDTTPPTVTINQAGAQADPTNAGSINFTVVFNEAVTDFDDAADVTLSGTAGATTINITGGPITYNVAVSGMTGNGTVIANVPASAVQDAAGNNNTASTSTDNTVTYDGTAPTVTINQAGAQADPTGTSPINFTVVFSEAVTDFDDAADVTLSGGAGATTIVITGGPTTYNVAVSGMTGNGTVIANVPASAAQDAAGNNNTASTGTDNTVTYDGTAPTATIDQAGAQADPTGTSPINFTVVFSEAVTDFDDAADVTLSGTAGATTIVITDGPITYNVAVSGMTGDGTVLVSVPANVAQDMAGNNNAASTSTDNSVVYDTVIPSVTINQAGAQADPTNAGSINFTVVFSEAVTDFNDAADVTLSGTAGATTINITGGPTTYNVAVSGMTVNGTVIANIPANATQDAGGNDNTASTSTDNTITYDNTAPTTTIDSNPTDPTNSVNASFTFSGTDTGSGVAGFECRLDAGIFGACTSPQSYTSLSDGSHTFEVRTVDNAGNTDASPASFTWVVDATAPETQVNSGPTAPTNLTTATFDFSGTDIGGTGVAGFECDLDGSGFSACSNLQNYSGLADGSHTFQVRAIDNVGNTDATPASYTWVVDAGAPNTTIDSAPPALDNNAMPAFTFSGSDAGTGVTGFECSVDAGAFGACTSPNALSLADGPHTFAVRAVDGLGNVDPTPASYSWTIDTTAPAAPVVSAPANGSSTNDATPTVTGTAEPNSTVTVYIDGSSVGTTTADGSGNWSFTVGTALSEGVHTVDATSTDAAGNVSPSSATNNFTVDSTAPDTTIDSSPLLISNSSSGAFTFSSTDGTATFECQLDGDGFTACTSPQNFAGLSSGSHTFEVRAVDGASNVDPSPASFTWTVDTGFPTVLFNANTIPANNASVTTGLTVITVSFSEDVTLASAQDLANYILIEDGVNNTFDTTAVDPCTSGVQPDDVTIVVNSVSYSNGTGSGPYIATLSINTGVALPLGSYRLYVCGTTSILDLAGNELNNGSNDTVLNFSVVSPSSGPQLPKTGFPQKTVTLLPAQPAELAYAATDFWLEIPTLKVKMSIMGIPKTQNGWDVTWLNKDAGWLNGSAYPTWNGNSVITGHVWDALNQPGPFAKLKNLQYGDQVKVHAFGQVYIYEIRASQTVSPASVSTVFKHEEKPWITLITCEDYKERSQTYSYRRMVRAVLVKVVEE